MENLKAKSFDLRKDTVDIIVAGKGGHMLSPSKRASVILPNFACASTAPGWLNARG